MGNEDDVAWCDNLKAVAADLWNIDKKTWLRSKKLMQQ
jgi:hypothetical protein